MEVYIGMGVSAASCTLAVISEKGRKPKGSPVETNGQTLDEVCRRADPAGRPSASCRNAAADCNGLLRRDLSVTDQERESGHFDFGENRTSVLCSDREPRSFDHPCSNESLGEKCGLGAWPQNGAMRRRKANPKDSPISACPGRPCGDLRTGARRLRPPDTRRRRGCPSGPSRSRRSRRCPAGGAAPSPLRRP